MGARSAALDRLQARVGSLGEGAWDFAAVDVFLAATESELRATVERELWRTDPHHWWLTRLLKAELRLRAGLPYDADKLYRATRDELDTRGLVDATPPDRVRQEPYAVRLARAEASNVISTAEEFTDWVLDADAIRQGVRPFLPEAPANSSAIVVRFEGRRGSYRLHEPNPRRTANMLGRFFGRVPRYLEADRQAVAIAPPPGMIDQRLLRQPGEETPLEEIPAGADAMFRFPLASSRVRDHVSRELASPRYVLAPDLLPVVFDGSAARSTSFGYLDGRNRVWVLRASDARALASRLKGPYQLAAFYRLEIHTDLGSPAWLSALVDGKASRLPTASPVAFRWLLHACRTTTGPIVLYASPDAELGGILTDGNDRPLACEVYVTALQ
jgi:hypothetical protein